jgi:hypothetical protein
MKREDVLVWISTAWFVGLCGLAVWYFSMSGRWNAALDDLPWVTN